MLTARQIMIGGLKATMFVVNPQDGEKTDTLSQIYYAHIELEQLRGTGYNPFSSILLVKGEGLAQAAAMHLAARLTSEAMAVAVHVPELKGFVMIRGSFDGPQGSLRPGSGVLPDGSIHE